MSKALGVFDNEVELGELEDFPVIKVENIKPDTIMRAADVMIGNKRATIVTIVMWARAAPLP